MIDDAEFCAEKGGNKGALFVISGPSGVGKGTMVSRLVSEYPGVWVSVSATTRAPRAGEINGESYFFLTKDEFEKLISEDGFVEWAKYQNNYYGTPVAPIKQHLDRGDAVILEIEVQGALQIKDKFPDAKLIFIEPPSIDELERRLRERGTESEEVINSRMMTAAMELEHKMEYDMRIVNDDIDEAMAKLASYIEVSKDEK